MTSVVTSAAPAVTAAATVATVAGAHSSSPQPPERLSRRCRCCLLFFVLWVLPPLSLAPIVPEPGQCTVLSASNTLPSKELKVSLAPSPTRAKPHDDKYFEIFSPPPHLHPHPVPETCLSNQCQHPCRESTPCLGPFPCGKCRPPCGTRLQEGIAASTRPRGV